MRRDESTPRSDPGSDPGSDREAAADPRVAARAGGVGMVGTTGALSGASLLQQLQRNGSSGTLVLQRGAGTALLLLDKGELQRTHRIGSYADIDEEGQRFRFDPHEPGTHPRLASLFVGSAVPVLRALPGFGPAHEIPTGISDLRALLRQLERDGFGGSLRLAHRDQHGLALLLGGRIAAAWFERDAYRLDRNDALRAIYRYSLEAERPPLALEPLPDPVLRALLGLATGRPPGDPNLATYSGLEADESGYHYYHQGERYLHVPAELVGTARRYRTLRDDDALPDLSLPDDPPGWEDQAYTLTLRGRDAINPLTELSMQFSEAFGDSGRRILDTLARGATIEQTAGKLGLDLQELKPWLRRLEEEGLIRLRS